VSKIRLGNPARGGWALDNSSVLDDGLVDTLWGGSDLDWFLLGRGDKAKDQAANEPLN
jgi:hypothetical protein